MSTTAKSNRPIRQAASEETTVISFPECGYVGVAAKFADLLSQFYETPKEFLYIDCLAHIGAAASGRVRTDFGVPCQPRLYALKIAPSAWMRKSTSTKLSENFVTAALNPKGDYIPLPPKNVTQNDCARVVYGAGSAEGLAKFLIPQKGVVTQRVVVQFDEMRRFEAKASTEGSVLRSLVNELFDGNAYHNPTLSNPIFIQDGHLCFLANTTDTTYRTMLDAAESRDIGFLNRLFLVTGNTSQRIARPQVPPDKLVAPMSKELASYFDGLPPLNPDGSAHEEVRLPLTPEAECIWDAWYSCLERNESTARLDSIGMRLLGLLAFTSGKGEIDADILLAVIAILEYQRKMRGLFKPIEAETPIARLEQAMVNQLKQRGPLSYRNLQRYSNAHRYGVFMYKLALFNLKDEGTIGLEEKMYMLLQDDLDE